MNCLPEFYEKGFSNRMIENNILRHRSGFASYQKTFV